MSKTNSVDIGNRIKNIRKVVSLSQKEFARKLGVSASTLSELESGKYKPGIELLIKLKNEFNINLHHVIFGEGDIFINPILSSYNRSNAFAVNPEDVREFLYYFEHSTIMQYHLLGVFKSKMVHDGIAIKKEIQRKK